MNTSNPMDNILASIFSRRSNHNIFASNEAVEHAAMQRFADAQAGRTPEARAEVNEAVAKAGIARIVRDSVKTHCTEGVKVWTRSILYGPALSKTEMHDLWIKLGGQPMRLEHADISAMKKLAGIKLDSAAKITDNAIGFEKAVGLIAPFAQGGSNVADASIAYWAAKG